MVYDSSCNKLLLLEDDKVHSARLERVVREAGFDFDLFEHYIGAARAAHEGTYCGAILDVMVPRDPSVGAEFSNYGLFVAERFWMESPTMPIALHTSSEDLTDVNRFVERGAVYIPKGHSIDSSAQVREFLASLRQ